MVLSNREDPDEMQPCVLSLFAIVPVLGFPVLLKQVKEIAEGQNRGAVYLKSLRFTKSDRKILFSDNGYEIVEN